MSGIDWSAQAEFSERWSNVRLPEFALVPLRGVTGRRLDLELTFRQEDALISGVVFQSWNGGAEGSAAVLYDWDSQRLEVRADFCRLLLCKCA